MPNSSVTTFAPGVSDPYGTYIELINKHRMEKMYSNPKNDYSVRGGSGNSEKATTNSKKGY